MKHTFYCETCGEKFESVGKKVTSHSRVFGPMWHLVAPCPKCGSQVGEYRQISSTKSGPASQSASCPTGTCPFLSN